MAYLFTRISGLNHSNLSAAALIFLLHLIIDSIQVVEAANNASTTNHTSSHVVPSNNTATQGWTPQPNNRGTIDIIFGCCSTLFLCSWSVLRLNVPGLNDRRREKFLRKTGWMLLAITGPEFVLGLSTTQWSSARDSVRGFKVSGYSGWTMTHAFFADMGGFFLKTEDSHLEPFPLSAKHVHYLVKERFIDYEEVRLENQALGNINKNDGLVWAFTILQTLWFFLTVITRWATGLAIPTLELTTFASVLCTLPTFFFWWEKPTVDVPIIISINASVDDIRSRFGHDAQTQYALTPLDFLGRSASSFQSYWSFWSTMIKSLGIPLGVRTQPLKHIPNDNFPVTTSLWSGVLSGTVTLSYLGMHVAAWNFHFPTNTERFLWRFLSVTVMASASFALVVDGIVFPILRWTKKRTTRKGVLENPKRKLSLARFTQRFDHIGNRLRTFGAQQDPLLDAPLKALLPVTIAGFCYMVGRVFLFAEDVVALRALPSSAYQNVNWTQCLPHF